MTLAAPHVRRAVRGPAGQHLQDAAAAAQVGRRRRARGAPGGQGDRLRRGRDPAAAGDLRGGPAARVGRAVRRPGAHRAVRPLAAGRGLGPAAGAAVGLVAHGALVAAQDRRQVRHRARRRPGGRRRRPHRAGRCSPSCRTFPPARPSPTARRWWRNVHWHAPLLDRDLLAECASAVLDEARLLGLLANDALTDLGRALAGLADQRRRRERRSRAAGGARSAAGGGLDAGRWPASGRSALFGADLTAVVTGPPSAELAGCWTGPPSGSRGARRRCGGSPPRACAARWIAAKTPTSCWPSCPGSARSRSRSNTWCATWPAGTAR